MARQDLHLLDLPDEVLVLPARQLLARGNVRDALRLFQASRRLGVVCEEVPVVAAARRLRWVELPEVGEAAWYEVSNDGFLFW